MKQLRKFMQIGLSLLAAIFLIIGVEPQAQATNQSKTLHVANNGVDSSGCGRKANPCRSIRQAIINASDGDRILVGPGRYGIESGEETGEIGFGCQCLVKVDKRVTILSTHGATATVVDARIFAFPEGSPVVAVRITTNGAVFGQPGHGFTLTGARQNDGLAIGAATDVTVAGNISSGNAGGFSIFGTGNVIKHNIAVGINGPGFDINGTAHTVRGNAAIGNGDGFIVQGFGHMLTDNVSIGNVTGYSLFGNAHLNHNAAVGNTDAGIRMEPGVQATVHRSNIFGNGDQTGSNCGVLNQSGQPITATDNFWGAASGPGADPADAVCDINGTTDFVPFAERLFRIAEPHF